MTTEAVNNNLNIFIDPTLFVYPIVCFSVSNY